MTDQVAWPPSLVGGLTGLLDVSEAPYSADRTGATDASAAINQAITDALAATPIKAVYIPPGNYMLTSPIVPANGVAIIGSGPESVLLPTGPVSAILLIGSAASYLTDVLFKDFKIDGAGQTGAYNVATKGIQCPWSRRVTCDNLQVVNCIATGIALDFPDECTIVNCVSNNNGRLWTAGQAGGAGIGIGVSDATTPDQSMIVSNCHCAGNGSYGIFFEAQDTFASNLTPGIRVIGNYCSGAKKAGIGISGGIGCIVQGNVCSNNGTAGAGTNTANISIDGGTLGRDSTENTIIDGNVCVNGKAHGILVVGLAAAGLPRWCKISNNVVYNNGGTSAQDGHGIFLNGSQHALIGFSVDANQVTQNKQGGIVLASGAGHANIAIRNNDVFSNGQAAGTTTDGISIGASVAGLEIIGNQVYKQGAIGNQVTGVNLLAGATITQAKISANDLRGNGTNAMLVNATIDATVQITDNAGFNPQGSSTIVPGASPFTYTAGPTPETVSVAAGTVSQIAVGNTGAATNTGLTSGSFDLAPAQTVVVTYTGAPTMVTNKR
jgi:hypothetical protein